MDTPLARLHPACAPGADSFGNALMTGLRQTPKQISAKYFYDAAGSQLFDEICALPEYYQTRTETELLQRHAPEIAALMGDGAEIVEFGAGSLRKIRILLDRGAARSYVPLDISGDYLQDVVRTLAGDYPTLAVRPIVADFTLPMDIPGQARRAGFFPGSTIGNFRPEAAMALLRRMRAVLNGGGLLIGVDLVKDPARLHAAYNDAAGVTARFNKNLLVRANRELGTNFAVDAFAHHAPYNVPMQRIEMYLVSLKRQVVTLRGQEFEFSQGEALYTEDSHKYTIDGFRDLATRAGFSPRAVWTDKEALFSVHWLESR
jgi:dimethylhistidine N-methyltransferase